MESRTGLRAFTRVSSSSDSSSSDDGIDGNEILVNFLIEELMESTDDEDQIIQRMVMDQLDQEDALRKVTEAEMPRPPRKRKYTRKDRESRGIRLYNDYYLSTRPKQVISSDMEKSVSHNRKRALDNGFCERLKAKSPVMERAIEIQANLAPQFPSFIQTMLPSNVNQRYGIRLPKEFCNLHLLPHDTTVHLVDESGEEYIVSSHMESSGRCALSGGWKFFSIANKLLAGDVLVFQLVNPSKFKVYIARAKGLTEADGALGLLNLDTRDDSVVRPLPKNIDQENFQQESPMILKSNVVDQSEIGSEDLGSKTSDFFVVDFKEMGSIENFTILLNGSCINSKLSEYHTTKYYELCRTRKSFLHTHLLKTVTCKLAADIISQTVNIADAIRDCKIFTSKDDYSTWDKTLEGFELLGMDVGYLRAKISRLLSLSFESEEAADSKKFKEARFQQSRAEFKIRTLELELLDLKKEVKTLDLEMETLKVKAERREVMFQEEVNVPWL